MYRRSRKRIKTRYLHAVTAQVGNSCFFDFAQPEGRILAQVMTYRRPRIDRDDHLDQSEAYDIS